MAHPNKYNPIHNGLNKLTISPKKKKKKKKKLKKNYKM